ncbi:corticotropin-releasing factor receptor 1-like [Limulus polyphemus]|uniref:Corticotropin-releasing factor receptor 1-like n=1 Tax=Limulus polyphemus TaxID=6850 RepID=A0ABM1S6I0_LIMPO|nr:corticotropin-releasing factor receptor 1-like [Limulus polyphemus]
MPIVEEIGSNADCVRCSAIWDSVYCWPETPAGQIVIKSCAEIFASADVNLKPSEQKIVGNAYRKCNEDGNWLWGNWTNYTECLEFSTTRPVAVPILVSYILLVGSVISLFFMSITLFVFLYFKSLRCPRIRVHQNLVVALIVHAVMLILLSLHVVVGGTFWSTYLEVGWLCRTVLTIKMYSGLACINWMFNEGLLLHSRTATSVFRRDAPFKLYYFIGWGFPIIIVTAWAITMNFYVDSSCWQGYGDYPYVWIITTPMLLTLSVNFFFLVNVIRILVTKLHSREVTHIGRAVKATALLFPLLGVSHLLFCVNPHDDAGIEEAYMIFNAILQSSQGLFVSIFHCFMNTEVQKVLRNAYLRAIARRSANSGSRNQNLSHTYSFYGDVSASCSHRHKRASPKNANIRMLEVTDGKISDVTCTQV